MPRRRKNRKTKTEADKRAARWPWAVVVILGSAIIFLSVYSIITYNSATEDGSEIIEPPVHVRSRNIGFTPIPELAPQDLIKRATKRAGIPPDSRIEDSNQLSALSVALEAEPWVKKVIVKSVRTADSTEFQIEYCRPALWWATSRGDRFLDEDLIMLVPGVGRDVFSKSLLRLESGVSLPVREPGEQMRTPALRAAIDLAVQSYQYKHLSLTTIILSSDRIRPDLRLRTSGGSEIVWHPVPRNESGQRISDESKWGMLDEYLKSEGSLERPSGPYRFEFDIAHSPPRLLRSVR